MTRIRFKMLKAMTLLLPLLLGIGKAELEFYQDVGPKLSSSNLERLMRFLEQKTHSPSLQHQQQHHYNNQPYDHQFEQLQQRIHRSHHHQQQQPQPQLQEPTLEEYEIEAQQQRYLQQQHELQQQRKYQQYLLELWREKQRGLLKDDLPERPAILDKLQREEQHGGNPINYMGELERQKLLPYLRYEPERRFKQYSEEDEARARLLPAHLNKDPQLDYPETQYVDFDRTQPSRVDHSNMARPVDNSDEAYRRRPQFTYSFDKLEPVNENDPRPFAVKPNDPRYYENDDAVEREAADLVPIRPHQGQHHHHQQQKQQDQQEHHHHQQQQQQQQHHHQETQKHHGEMHEVKSSEDDGKKVEPTTLRSRKPAKINAEEGEEEKEEDRSKSGLLDMSFMPEPQRRAEQDPLVVSLTHPVNADIYFIAIVAGCSAAAMFGLVLISLTWCRFQRVSKAAADVEYPAYGVTGPNKDISPSGDQRLAQSAQMYHFQHQKQQIIAMEKPSTRDPGSVSEAESDEENEEGDYTVYECPGLAPTGEMEVKNPLFHDDPTPATPGKLKKDYDDDV